MSKLNLVLLTAMSLVVTTCTLEATVGLPNDEPINNMLLGEWSTTGSQNKIIITERNSMQYNIIDFTAPLVDGLEKTQRDTTIAYIKKVGKHHILNTSYSAQESIFMFHKLEVYKDKFKMTEIKQDSTIMNFINEAEILKYFKSNINKKGFFTEESETFKRVK